MRTLPFHSFFSRKMFYSGEYIYFLKNSTDRKYTSFVTHHPVNLLFSMDQFFYTSLKRNFSRKKSSEFQKQLKERKKVALFYGYLSKKHFLDLLEQAKKKTGYFSRHFFCLLEKRIDIALYRAGFAQNRAMARQYLTHQHLSLNHHVMDHPTYFLQPADIVCIHSDSRFHIQKKILNRVEALTEKKKKRSLFSQQSSRRDPSPFFENKVMSFIKHLISLSQNNAYYKIVKDPLSVGERVIYKYKKAFFSPLSSPNNNKSDTLSETISKQVLTPDVWWTSLSKKEDFGERALKTHFFFKVKPFPFSQRTAYDENKYRVLLKKKKDLKKKNLFQQLSKKVLLDIRKQIQESRGLKHVFEYKSRSSLHHQKKPSPENTIYRLCGKKPLHLEISYQKALFIYLYTPQRLFFPFYLDMDLIQKTYG